MDSNNKADFKMIKDKRIKKVEDVPGKGQWLTISSASKKLKIPYNTLYYRVRAGDIEAINWQGITLINVIAPRGGKGVISDE